MSFGSLLSNKQTLVEAFENSSFGKWKRKLLLASVTYGCYLLNLFRTRPGDVIFQEHLAHFLYESINRITYHVEEGNTSGKEHAKEYFISSTLFCLPLQKMNQWMEGLPQGLSSNKESQSIYTQGSSSNGSSGFYLSLPSTYWVKRSQALSDQLRSWEYEI